MIWKFTLVSLSLLLLSVTQAQSLDGSKYPGVDRVATARDEWTQAIADSVPNSPGPRTQGGPTDWSKDITRCTAASNQWGLTFDDGPGPYTDSIVSALRDKGVKATFFVVGSRIRENAAPLKRAYDAGHQIGIHTWSHPYLTTLTTGQVVAELVYTAMAIKEIIGVTPKAFRPPYGDIDDRVRAVAKALDLDVVIWNADVNDFEMSGASAGNKSAVDALVNRIRQIAQNTKQGTISLEHDLYTVPSQAGIQAISVISDAGYAIKSVSECTSTTAYSENLWSKLKVPAPQTTNTTSTNSTSANSTTPANNTTSSNNSTNTSSTASTAVTGSSAPTTGVAPSNSSPSPSPSQSARSSANIISRTVSLLTASSIILMAWMI